MRGHVRGHVDARTPCMRVNFSRFPALLKATSVAFLIAALLIRELGVSRFWAVPAGLYVAVQLQKNGYL